MAWLYMVAAALTPKFPHPRFIVLVSVVTGGQAGGKPVAIWSSVPLLFLSRAYFRVGVEVALGVRIGDMCFMSLFVSTLSE